VSVARAQRRDGADGIPLFAIAYTAGALATAGLCVLAVRQPITALVLFLATAGFALCIWRVDVALLVLVAVGPLEAAYRPSSGFSLTKVAGALAFASFAFHALVTRRRLILEGTHLLVLLLLAVSLISTVNAHDQSSAATTVLRYTSFVAMFFVISQFGDDHDLLRRIAWVLTLASAAASYFALANLFSGRSLLAGLPYANENDVAFTLATTLPLALWLVREPGVKRLVALASSATILSAIVLTFSRGAFVGLAAAAAWKLVAERRHLGTVAFGGLAALATILLLVNVNSSQVHKASLAKQKVAQENVQSRLDAWSGAARLAADHPLVGVGPGNFQSNFFRVTGRPSGSLLLTEVHNTYLDVAAELGVVALILFVSFVVMSFSHAVQAERQSLGPPGLASALATAFVVAAVSGSFISAQYSAPFWLLGALTAALWSQRTPKTAFSA
jgi:putative inorganic carbon (hco3(-)) transporter